MRSLTMLNQFGDLTLTWTADRDAEMEEVIKAQLARGVRFFIIKPFTKEEIEIKEINDIVARNVLVKDNDVLTMFNKEVKVEGLAPLVKDKKVGFLKRKAGALIDMVKATTDTKEIVTSNSIGTAPLKGG